MSATNDRDGWSKKACPAHTHDTVDKTNPGKPDLLRRGAVLHDDAKHTSNAVDSVQSRPIRFPRLRLPGSSRYITDEDLEHARQGWKIRSQQFPEFFEEELYQFHKARRPIIARMDRIESILDNHTTAKTASPIFDYERDKQGVITGIRRDQRGNYKILGYGSPNIDPEVFKHDCGDSHQPMSENSIDSDRKNNTEALTVNEQSMLAAPKPTYEPKPVPKILARLAPWEWMIVSSTSVRDDFQKSVLDQGLAVLHTPQPVWKDFGAIVALAQSIRYQIGPVHKLVAPNSDFPTGTDEEVEKSWLVSLILANGGHRYRYHLKLWLKNMEDVFPKLRFADTYWFYPIQLQFLLSCVCLNYRMPPIRLGIAMEMLSPVDCTKVDTPCDIIKALKRIPFVRFGNDNLFVSHLTDIDVSIGDEREAEELAMNHEPVTVWIGCKNLLEYHAIGPASEKATSDMTDFDFSLKSFMTFK